MKQREVLHQRWAGVLFDLDGTLADTIELILMSFRHTVRTHMDEPVADERLMEGIGTPLRTQMRSLAGPEHDVEELVRTYADYQRSIHDEWASPYPGASDVLAAFARGGARLGVVTSKRSRIARRTLEVCGLRDQVEVVVAADQVLNGKPDPEPVFRALSELGLTGREEEVLFVGDSPHDLRAGRSAGTRTAAALWGPFARAVLEAEAPDYLVDALPDLLSLRR